MAFNVTKVLK